MREFVLLLPEIFLIVTIAGIIGGEISQGGERVRFTTAIALVGLIGAFFQTLLTCRIGPSLALAQTVSIDGFSLFFKLASIALAALVVATSIRTKEIVSEKRSEFCALVVGAALAMCVISSAADLLLAFLAFQMLNTISYFIAAYGKKSGPSAEAAVKQMAFGAVAGVLMLYGIGILFVYAKTLNIYEMHKVLLAAPLSNEIMAIVFMLIFLPLAYQIAAFPMHLWAPDVLEGAPTPASAFIALSSRMAGFAFAIRFLIVVFAQPALSGQGHWQVLGSMDWTRILAIVAGATMLGGALLAFRQQGAKRLVAGLIVAETGFLLLGLLVLDEVGVAALLFNLLVQLFAVCGVYYVISLLVDELGTDRLEKLRGAVSCTVLESIVFILFLACIVGLPPLPGFIGKFALIGAAVRHEWYPLAILAILSMILGVAAIARIAYSLLGSVHLGSNHSSTLTLTRSVHLAVLVVPLIIMAVFAEFFLSWAGQSLQFILW